MANGKEQGSNGVSPTPSPVILSEAEGKDLALKDFLPYFKSARVWLSTLLHSVIAGGAGGVLMHFKDPKDFEFTAAGMAKLKWIFLGGAAIAIFNLFARPPRPGSKAENGN